MGLRCQRKAGAETCPCKSLQTSFKNGRRRFQVEHPANARAAALCVALGPLFRAIRGDVRLDEKTGLIFGGSEHNCGPSAATHSLVPAIHGGGLVVTVTGREGLRKAARKKLGKHLPCFQSCLQKSSQDKSQKKLPDVVAIRPKAHGWTRWALRPRPPSMRHVS